MNVNDLIELYPSKILKQHCAPIEDFSKDTIKELNVALSTICHMCKGMGLAAPQIGTAVQAFYVSKEVAKDRPTFFANPEIVSMEGDCKYKEGCLSFPKIYGWIGRFIDITVKAYDENGNPFEVHIDNCLEDEYGIVIQHEIDHLQGICFIDKFNPWEYDKVVERINKMRRKHAKKS